MCERDEPIWKRPESIEFPKIWYTFEAKDVDSDNIITYRIQDLSEERHEEVIEIMVEHFIKYAPLCVAYGKTMT